MPVSNASIWRLSEAVAYPFHDLERRTVNTVYSRYYELLPPAGLRKDYTRQELKRSTSLRQNSATAQAAYSKLTLHSRVTQGQIWKKLKEGVDFTRLSTAICRRFRLVL
jgi:hypothetical protein